MLVNNVTVQFFMSALIKVEISKLDYARFSNERHIFRRGAYSSTGTYYMKYGKHM